MGKDTNWYPWFPGDFARDTKHLSTLEKGAYRELLDAYYCTGPLPADENKLRQIAGLTNRQWAHSREALLAFFDPPTEILGAVLRTHKKCDLLMSQREHIRSTRSEAGYAGNSKRWANKPDRKPDRKPIANPSQTPSQTDRKSVATTTTEERAKKEALSSSGSAGARACAVVAPELPDGARAPDASLPQMEAAPVVRLAYDREREEQAVGVIAGLAEAIRLPPPPEPSPDEIAASRDRQLAALGFGCNPEQARAKLAVIAEQRAVAASP